MKRKVLYMLVCLFCLTGTGCGDFLKEFSRDLTYAESWEDLQELLIGSGYIRASTMDSPVIFEQHYPYLYVMDDDAAASNPVSDNINISSYYAYLYYAFIWQQVPYGRYRANNDKPWDDTVFKDFYEYIANLNVIEKWVDEFPNDPIEEKIRLRGEAQFLRAYYYLMLSNIYGWAYDVGNGGSDPGIPLKTSEWITKEKFSRATVATVYGSILSDLENACENLKDVQQPSFYRATHLSSRVLASRVWLYMEQYDKVIEHCDEALKLGCPLADLNTYGNTHSTLPIVWNNFLTSSNPEIIFTMGGYTQASRFFTGHVYNSATQFVVSGDLKAEFRQDAEVEDSRYYNFFRPNPRDPNRWSLMKNRDNSVTNVAKPDVYDTFLLRSAEVYLNKAEAQAMTGDLSGAVVTLTPLLENRYTPGKLPRIGSLGEEDLVNFIRAERRRELCFEGHRWQDLKRYSLNSKYPLKKSITHETVGTNNSILESYTLKPYGEDMGWIMPIPQREIDYNVEVDHDTGDVTFRYIENPARPDRSPDR